MTLRAYKSSPEVKHKTNCCHIFFIVFKVFRKCVPGYKDFSDAIGILNQCNNQLVINDYYA